MYTYETVLQALDSHVTESYKRQIMDKNSKSYGAFINETAPYPPTACRHFHDLTCACYAFMAGGSLLQGDEELFDRIRGGISFLKNVEMDNPYFDVLDWKYPAGHYFCVQMLSPVIDIARNNPSDNLDQTKEISDSLGEFLKPAAEQIIGKGFKTPNHRWVICSALAQAMKLFPEINAADYVESMVAETVDINEDGEYLERSTDKYNGITNRALRLMADYLGKPELLDPVRKNLEMMCYMFHADWTVEAVTSKRKDCSQRIVPSTIIDSFFDMAMRDHNGLWATVADNLFDNRSKNIELAWMVHPFLQNPDYRKNQLEREPFPNSLSKVFPVAKMWRVKRGLLSATAIADKETPFKLTYGKVSLSVKIFNKYIRPLQFKANTFSQTDTGVELSLKNAIRGFELPLGKEVSFNEFYKVGNQRERWELPPIDIILSISEIEMGFDIGLKTAGMLDGTAFRIEFCLQAPGEWETDQQKVEVCNGQTAVLKSGYAVFRKDEHGIRLGPGVMEHYITNHEEEKKDTTSFRVLCLLKTPIDYHFKIKYGTWSVATGKLEDY